MADSIPSSCVGSSPIYFPLLPNWASMPKLNYTLTRDFVAYPGTAQNMGIVTDRTPIDFVLRFMVDNKSDEYDLLTWLHAVYGRLKAFWIEHPVHLFDLIETVASGATSFKITPNQYDKIGQDDERIFFALKSGDTIVRTVTDSDYDFVNDELLITINEPTDRELTTDSYWVIGRFLLCRLKQDTLRQTMETSNITTYSIGFRELPYEYSYAAHGS